jgi:methyl-accepting chemotaxis protein
VLGIDSGNSYNGCMTQLSHPKRIWLINRDFQFRYAGAGLIAGLVSTLITATLIIYPLFIFKILTISLFLPWPILLTLLAAVIFNSIMQVILGILLTHRIAGPIFNLIRCLRMIAGGQWNIKMRQRKNDELGPVVRHLNEMSEEITKTVRSDIIHLEKIKGILATIESDSHQLGLINSYLDEMHQRFKLRIESTEN